MVSFQYQHRPYHFFEVFDPKQRHIGKACVKDRMIRKVSGNGTKPCYPLKMDIKKFFDTIDHSILKDLIRKKVDDEKSLKLIDLIIDSFYKKQENSRTVGLPLGNVTSQLFANIYLHELDHFVKQTLRIRYYVRFCDDFIFLSNHQEVLQILIPLIRYFLQQTLRLELHSHKVILRKLNQGVDFVGYILFAKHRVMRTQTKRRMKKRLRHTHKEFLLGKVSAATVDQQLQSYLGLLSHASQASLSQDLINAYWVRSPP